MAVAEFKAGGKFNFLSPDELNEGLRKLFEDWRVEAAKGPKPILFSGVGTVDANSNLIIGGDSRDNRGRMGPEQSMYWSVKRIALSGLDPNVDTPPLYIDNASPGRLVRPAITGPERFGSDELILAPGQQLLVAAANLVAPVGTRVFVAGAAFEVPTTMLYLLT